MGGSGRGRRGGRAGVGARRGSGFLDAEIELHVIGSGRWGVGNGLRFAYITEGDDEARNDATEISYLVLVVDFSEVCVGPAEAHAREDDLVDGAHRQGFVDGLWGICAECELPRKGLVESVAKNLVERFQGGRAIKSLNSFQLLTLSQTFIEFVASAFKHFQYLPGRGYLLYRDNLVGEGGARPKPLVLLVQPVAQLLHPDSSSTGITTTLREPSMSTTMSYPRLHGR